MTMLVPQGRCACFAIMSFGCDVIYFFVGATLNELSFLPSSFHSITYTHRMCVRIHRYIMAATASKNTDVTFSTCSAASFNAFAASQPPYDSVWYEGINCLSSIAPSNTWADGVCGDGVLSGDEECDTFGVQDNCCDAVRVQCGELLLKCWVSAGELWLAFGFLWT